MDRRVFFQQMLASGLIAASLTQSMGADSPHPAGAISSKVKWQTSLKAAQKLALQQNKPILIVFGASWCPPCRKLENETLCDRRTVAMIEREFIPVHLDYEKEPKIVKILEVERLPCLVILTPEADLLHKSVGFAEAKEFQSKLTAALEKRAEVQQVQATAPVR